ncbi:MULTISPECIES: DUF3823 domain-containing protein [Olivibacter]|jgi:hypothetical protein|uniref:DUF3823 domain-containing protein n=2 Tax=Olivibacter TaxID=376469 RepID=A0ABV6HCU7_9SPHI|nr:MULTISPECIES: DUF3823 domain-containing protein [Olivibacter]MDM8172762.1 DUF3823 domain-containing protein [Olivibacter sp. 47]QEL04220.1 DUF3823 domain-containing protein [Olivibacter sp. LS-1]
MKKYCIYSLLIFVTLLAGCGKDNYDEPTSTLTGRIVYQGEPLQLKGTNESVRVQLFQDGYDFRTPLDVFVSQDGSFSAKLFDGHYKLVTRDGNGPWLNTRDTTEVELRGTASVDLEVTPYFTISNSSISLSGNVMNTSFTINQIVDAAQIDRVMLLLNTTTFVDEVANVVRAEYTGDDVQVGQMALNVDFSDEPDAVNGRALFGRICVWPSGSDQGIYSPVVRLR